jgi:two-component system response regulator
VANNSTILLAEDNPDDVLLVRLAFKKAGFNNQIIAVDDGLQVIQYLKGEGAFADRQQCPLPGVLLLDLNMPKLNGLDVLSWIRRQPEHLALPVIMFTTSYFGQEINRAYELGANSFLTKPTDFREFISIVKQMAEFWLGATRLPEPGVQAPAGPSPDTAPAPTELAQAPGQSRPMHPQRSRARHEFPAG